MIPAKEVPLMVKQLFAIMLISMSLSTVVGFALGTASAPQSAGAASGSSEVVTQLRKLNNKMAVLDKNTATLNTQIGTQQQSQGSVRGLLTIICDYTTPIDCKQ
ncbi:MAG: hypothetical protein ABR536_06385 [Solirubrobacterales bacterium]